MKTKSYGKDCSKLARDLRVLERKHDTTRKIIREGAKEARVRGRELDQRLEMLYEIVFGHAKQRVPPAHTPEL